MIMKIQSTHVVVIGAGYAGMLATLRLAGKTRRRDIAITLVNAADSFVERLRLHQLAANQSIPSHPISELLRNTGVTFVQGLVTAIDPVERQLTINGDAGAQRLPYHYLLYALGSTTDRDIVPGVRAHAYTLTPGGPLSAASLRELLPTLPKQSRLLIGGGGATGIEAAAEWAESYPHLHVHLVTRGAFGLFLGPSVAAYMYKALGRLGVTIQDQTNIVGVEPGAALTAGGVLPFDVCVWTGGFVAPGLAREAGLEVNERGQVLVDPYMRSISHPGIYAVGDAAHPVEEPGVRVRMSAYTATIMGAHGADCIAGAISGKTPKPLSFAYAGQGIALGRRDAIGFNNYPDDHPNRPYFTGRTGVAVREFFVNLLASLPAWERRWPGFFYWLGKGRYAAKKQRGLRSLTSPVRTTR
jgi:NADH dehydrogenase FAD-containing subunit